MKTRAELEEELIIEYSTVLQFATESRWNEFVDACYQEYLDELTDSND